MHGLLVVGEVSVGCVITLFVLVSFGVRAPSRCSSFPSPACHVSTFSQSVSLVNFFSQFYLIRLSVFSQPFSHYSQPDHLTNVTSICAFVIGCPCIYVVIFPLNFDLGLYVGLISLYLYWIFILTVFESNFVSLAQLFLYFVLLLATLV